MFFFRTTFFLPSIKLKLAMCPSYKNALRYNPTRNIREINTCLVPDPISVCRFYYVGTFPISKLKHRLISNGPMFPNKLGDSPLARMARECTKVCAFCVLGNPRNTKRTYQIKRRPVQNERTLGAKDANRRIRHGKQAINRGISHLMETPYADGFRIWKGFSAGLTRGLKFMTFR